MLGVGEVCNDPCCCSKSLTEWGISRRLLHAGFILARPLTQPQTHRDSKHSIIIIIIIIIKPIPTPLSTSLFLSHDSRVSSLCNCQASMSLQDQILAVPATLLLMRTKKGEHVCPLANTLHFRVHPLATGSLDTKLLEWPSLWALASCPGGCSQPFSCFEADRIFSSSEHR